MYFSRPMMSHSGKKQVVNGFEYNFLDRSSSSSLSSSAMVGEVSLSASSLVSDLVLGPTPGHSTGSCSSG